jgi:drug/metabolite transporter (DMT)-like permease
LHQQRDHTQEVRVSERAAPWKTHAALVVVQLAFGTGAVEGKLAMAPLAAGGGGVTPAALAMTRMVGATAFFHGLRALTRASGDRERVGKMDHLRLMGLSWLGIVLNQALYLYGLHYTRPSTASLIGATIPVFAAALAIVARQEKASARTAAGLALSLGGVVCLTGLSRPDWGALIIAGNCLCYALYLVLARDVIRRLGALTVVTWIFTWGALFFSPLGVPALAHEAAAWSSRAWWLVGFVVLIPTIVAYGANSWALGRASAALVAIYIYLQPLVTILLEWAQLGRGLSTRALISTALIIAGVAIVASRHTPAIVRRSVPRA